jgi:hypothetical protein
MRPLLATMQPLERVIVHETSQSQSFREFAVPEQSDGLGLWNLVHVGYQDYVSLIRLTVGSDKRWKGIVQHCILHIALMVPGQGAVDWIVYNEVQYLIFEFFEPTPVVPQDGLVRKASECCSGLDNDKVVNIWRQSA